MPPSTATSPSPRLGPDTAAIPAKAGIHLDSGMEAKLDYAVLPAAPFGPSTPSMFAPASGLRSPLRPHDEPSVMRAVVDSADLRSSRYQERSAAGIRP